MVELQNEDNFETFILTSYIDNNWQEILNTNVNSHEKNARRLLWAWPSIEDLVFIEILIRENNINNVLSIGCGNGLFEWLLERCTDLKVRGIEVNEPWWKSKYCGPKFIPLHFLKSTSDLTLLLKKDEALLFCYFNDGVAFKRYIDAYEGDLIVIIGPNKGTYIYTNPDPLNPNFENNNWKLIGQKAFTDGKNVVSIFKKENEKH